jgi:hypothetical protein
MSRSVADSTVPSRIPDCIPRTLYRQHDMHLMCSVLNSAPAHLYQMSSVLNVAPAHAY